MFRKQIQRHMPEHVTGFAGLHNRIQRIEVDQYATQDMLTEGIKSKTELWRSGKQKMPTFRENPFEFGEMVAGQDPEKISLFDSKTHGEELKKEFEKKQAKRQNLIHILTKHSGWGDVHLITTMGGQKVERATHATRQLGEAYVHKEIPSEKIIAIKWTNRTERSTRKKIMEIAKRLGIPVYGVNGRRVWPPIVKK